MFGPFHTESTLSSRWDYFLSSSSLVILDRWNSILEEVYGSNSVDSILGGRYVFISSLSACEQ